MSEDYTVMARWKSDDLDATALYRRKKEMVIREAARAFSRNGYHGTSLEDIAKQLGVTKAALYYYVKSKQQILFACHGLALDLAEAALEAAAETPGNGLDKLTVFTAAYVHAVTQPLGMVVMLEDVHCLEPEHLDVVTRRRLTLSDSLEELIRDGLSDGSIFTTAPPVTAVQLLLGAIHAIPRWRQQNTIPPATTLADQYADMTRRMLTA